LKNCPNINEDELEEIYKYILLGPTKNNQKYMRAFRSSYVSNSTERIRCVEACSGRGHAKENIDLKNGRIITTLAILNRTHKQIKKKET